MKRLLLAVLLLLATCHLGLTQPQYKVLYRFLGSPNDGYGPGGDLVSDNVGNLYGVTTEGGTTGHGTIFELSPSSGGGWVETVLYNFCANQQCLDGIFPMAGLMRDAAGNLYGTAYGGGNQPCPYWAGGCGTVFELSPPARPGTAWTQTVLYNFCSSEVDGVCLDGAFPQGRLIHDAAGNLYGAASIGGSGGAAGASGRLGGVVFELQYSRGAWKEGVLYNFCSLGQGENCPDGNTPIAGVTFDTFGNLLGTTEFGGSESSQGGGTIYKLSPSASGWVESVTYAAMSPYNYGANPVAVISLDADGNLYSTAATGGPGGLGGNGSVFKLNPSGKKGRSLIFTGSNGAGPVAGLLISARSRAVYGTTELGGSNNAGVIFSAAVDGKETVLYSFCSEPNCSDGSSPVGGLIEDRSGNLYGTTELGGINEGGPGGVVFEITP